MTETVLVTGGNGYIAGWCIVGLLRRGYAVRATLRDASREAALRMSVKAGGESDECLSICIADLTRDAGWDEAIAGCDHVLHVASPLGGKATGGRDAFVAAARDGTLRVLDAAVKAGVKRVVMTSAAATTRPPLDSGRISEETNWADPEDPQFDAYRRSKILAERAAWEFMDAHPATAFTTILPGAVFGPILNADARGSVQIIGDLLEGKPAALPRLGFWIVDVRDLADLHIEAMTAPQAAGQRFIAAGDFLWLEDMARILRARLGKRGAQVPSRRLPGFVVKLLLPFRPHLRTLAPLIGRRFELTSRKARQVLGFSPRPVEATLTDCAESLLVEKASSNPR